MSSEDWTEADQCGKQSNGDSENTITPMCSTPAGHGSRMISPRTGASENDSGISQVFSPPDFDGNSKVDSSISSGLEDIDKTRSAALACRSRRSKRSCTWIGLILVWLGVLLLVVMIPYCSLQIQEYKTVVSDIVSYYGWKFLPYSGFICSVLLSFLFKLYLDSNYFQSQDKKRYEHVDKDELTTAYRRNSSAEVFKTADTCATASATTTHHDFQCHRTFSGTGNDTWHDFKKYFGNLAVLNSWSKGQSRRR